ncbi:TonB-dependent receptor [Sphingobium subterraneum]|uniref:Iron complex outermembrane receptor protein n=1 Tax=Sphingobium subterraneum TaxID=627688 RepID=A0A841J3K5_9SPHN|nr:TonB-dependent receptor [Sphingobium subterraneum]MBB6125364.1 iron complex outermembrane receptor protein [Sphingobium subterraneum]
MRLLKPAFWRTGASLGIMLATAGTACAAPSDAAPDASGSEDILVIGEHVSLTTPVSTGSRLGLSSLQTPASIAVVNGDDIRLRGDMSVVEAVTRAPGITTGANPGNGGTALSARGFSGQGSVLQLVDGVRLFPVASTITFPADPWNIDRIEVLSGPASVLYGQGALGGAVNVVTKAPNADHTVVEGEAGYGSQNTAHVAAGVGGPINPMLSYRADASYRRSDGYVDRGDSHSLALSGALRFAPSETLKITLRDDYGDIHPSKYFGTPLIAGRLDTRIRERNYNVSDAQMWSKDNRLTLTVDWAVSDAITLSNVGYYLTSERRWRNLETYRWVPDGTIFRTDNFGIVHDQKQWGDQSSVRLSTPLGGGISNDLVVGFDVNLIRLVYSHDFDTDTQEDVVDPFTFGPGLFLDTQGIAPRYRSRTLEWSLFAEDRLKISDALSIVGGVRWERDRVSRYNFVYTGNQITGETPALNGGTSPTKRLRNTTWRVGAVYQPNPNVSLYAQYATGVDPLGTLTNYSTSASQYLFTNATGDQFEGGVKASFLGGKGSATLSAYKIVKHNLVTQRTVTSPLQQIGQRSSKGIEASLRLQLPEGFAVDANGTVLKARYDDFPNGGTSYTGNVPAGVPQESANLWLSWTGGKMGARAGIRYVGHSFSDDANQYRVPGYTVVDAGLSYALTPNVALDVRLYNLFDKDYALNAYGDEQWILGRPRSVDVSVRARF